MKKFLLIGMLIAVSTIVFIKCEKASLVNKESKKMNRTKNASGLEYEILKEGKGRSPKIGENVIVHYTGWLEKNGELGSKFDSSLDRGQPFVFQLGKGYVIKGWDEGVATMKIGEKRRLYIPSHLGYGPRGIANIIPPDAILIFDIELLNIS